MLAIKSYFLESLGFAVGTKIFHSSFPLDQTVHVKLVVTAGSDINPFIKAYRALFFFVEHFVGRCPLQLLFSHLYLGGLYVINIDDLFQVLRGSTATEINPDCNLNMN